MARTARAGSSLGPTPMAGLVRTPMGGIAQELNVPRFHPASTCNASRVALYGYRARCAKGTPPMGSRPGWGSSQRPMPRAGVGRISPQVELAPIPFGFHELGFFALPSTGDRGRNAFDVAAIGKTREVDIRRWSRWFPIPDPPWEFPWPDPEAAEREDLIAEFEDKKAQFEARIASTRKRA